MKLTHCWWHESSMRTPNKIMEMWSWSQNFSYLIHLVQWMQRVMMVFTRGPTFLSSTALEKSRNDMKPNHAHTDTQAVQAKPWEWTALGFHHLECYITMYIFPCTVHFFNGLSYLFHKYMYINLFNLFTPMISLVILLIVFYTIFMTWVWRIWYCIN